MLDINQTTLTCLSLIRLHVALQFALIIYDNSYFYSLKKKAYVLKKDNESIETDKRETDLTFGGEGVRKIDDVREIAYILLTRDGKERESEAGRIS